ncbi:MAG TPA: alpha/beta hydrolase [Rhodospirillales bacterium]|nr:alpha/beta hydrolase [Rhodospirillales bacterium]
MVVCPGGGYNILAWPKEGLELAEWFNSFGVSAVVLKYRVPRRHPKYPHREPMQDGQRALRLVRYNAAEWNIDSERIGLLGFSTGAHLSLMVATQHQSDSYMRIDTADDVSARPNFVCPIYVAYLGPNYSDDRPELGSLVKISQNTPPAFMAVTLDDSYRGLQTGLLLNQFKQAGVSAESHIYAVGGHGYGIRPSGNPISSWHHRLQDWMRSSGLFQSPNES